MNLENMRLVEDGVPMERLPRRFVGTYLRREGGATIVEEIYPGMFRTELGALIDQDGNASTGRWDDLMELVRGTQQP